MMPATLHNQLMYKQILYSLLLSILIVSCGGDNSTSPSNENSSDSHGSEIPCDATNEGTIIKPFDSNVEHICKGGSWIAIGRSSSSSNIITNETKQSSSSSSYNVILSASEESSSSVKSVILSSDSDELSSSSSSSVIASETKQSSSSGYDNDDSSSSSEKPVESSSSEETKLYLCEDNETYVLDPANCEKISSSSVVVSSSSDNKLISSSNEIQESSSSEMSSSSEKIDSSSSNVESSSSETATQSSSEKVEESSSSEEIVESSSSEINVVSSSSLNSVYDVVNNTLTDLRDGQVYKTVTIGSQVWMAQNLNYLPKDTSGTIWAGKSLCGGGEWKKTAEGDCSIYGRLYESKFTFTDTDSYRKLCPNGWSLPTKKQYETLISFLGDKAIDKMKIQNSSYWNISESITSSGFAAIPAGYYTPYGGFNDQENEAKSVAYFGFIYNSKNIIAIIEDRTDFRWTTFGTAYYMSIRCIKE
ncbi:FISUMP domain-containing protein [uncultured Fibrobacter sp.]|uniref:FISUMP domain-containing protein n=1 Tax=uncultured Fibrobacter sp. TaxID=261512 RepID=UPI0025D7D318|nr:FISUMP domain-containing protein [uncultured Fibrobacter sp.]